MIITKIGTYKLLKDIKTSNATSIGTIPKDTVIEITQIDKNHHKIIGPQLLDWKYWDLPVEPIGEE